MALTLILSGLNCYAQSWRIIPVVTEVNSSFRALSVPDDSVAWVSGSNGTIGLSEDGGQSWHFTSIEGYEELDFRSLYAFNNKEAVIANAGSPAYIFITYDGGKKWKMVYENNDPAAFIDGMDFADRNNGIVYGDPADGTMLMMTTNDGGKTWLQPPEEKRITVVEGEASFAASNTGLKFYGKEKVAMITGGTLTRIHFAEKGEMIWRSSSLPMIHGAPTTGAFSVAFCGNKRGIIVGGNYKKEDMAIDHVIITSNGGKSWHRPSVTTGGFRECVIWLNKSSAIAVGPGGSDCSYDGGERWQPLSDTKGLHVVAKARRGNRIIAAGKNSIMLFVCTPGQTPSGDSFRTN